MPLTTKDLNYLKDEMSWELLAFKKCHHYAQECQDPQIKSQIEMIGQKHQQHYEQLLQYLNSHSTGAGQQSQSMNQ